MQTRAMAHRTWRRSLCAVGFLVANVEPCLTSAASAQSGREALIQIEVGDSIGLPLPDATVEVFTYVTGGVFWEWAPVGASDLPEGINLLRFSHPGYRPAVFSVPLRRGSKVSLRVRLEPERDTLKPAEVVARGIRAIGLSLEGRAKTDIIGRRRVLDRRALEGQSISTFGGLLRRARGTELNVLPASGGTFRAFAQSGSGGFNCPASVMVNGDRRRVLPFDTFDRLFSVDEVEAIEVFPRASSLPLSYQVPNARCGIMVVWFKVP